MSRELSEVLSSGEITSYVKGTDTDNELLTQAEIETAVDTKLTDGSITAINIGGTDTGNAVMTTDEVDTEIETKLTDGSISDIYTGGTDEGNKLLNKDEFEAYNREQNMLYWKGEHVNGVSYQKGDIVSDGSWLMIANTDTADTAAPIPAGSAVWNYPTDTLVEVATSANFINFGIRIAVAQSVFLKGYRVYMLEGMTYTSFFIKDPNGEAIIHQDNIVTATADGWVIVNMTPTLIEAGAVYDLVIQVRLASEISSTTTANYNYVLVNTETAPEVGQITHSAWPASQMLISTTDADANDQTQSGYSLYTLTVGDTITYDTMVWTVEAITIYDEYYELEVTPASRHWDTGSTLFTFDHTDVTTITYHAETDYWVDNDNIYGLIGVDTAYSSMSLSNDQYGIDVRYQPAYISPDWDVMVGSQGALSSVSSDLMALQTEVKANRFTVYESPVSFSPTLSIAEIESIVPTPLEPHTKFIIKDPDYTYIVYYDGSLYHYERLSVAT